MSFSSFAKSLPPELTHGQFPMILAIAVTFWVIVGLVKSKILRAVIRWALSAVTSPFRLVWRLLRLPSRLYRRHVARAARDLPRYNVRDRQGPQGSPVRSNRERAIPMTVATASQVARWTVRVGRVVMRGGRGFVTAINRCARWLTYPAWVGMRHRVAKEWLDQPLSKAEANRHHCGEWHCARVASGSPRVETYEWTLACLHCTVDATGGDAVITVREVFSRCDGKARRTFALQSDPCALLRTWCGAEYIDVPDPVVAVGENTGDSDPTATSGDRPAVVADADADARASAS